MAAYAALVSVMQIIHQIENHPFPPISLDKQQVESLTQKVNLLQEFLEGYDSPFGYSDQADPLEMRIADAAYAAEDVIESYIVDNIKLQVKTRIQITTFHKDVQKVMLEEIKKDVRKVIEEMDLLVREVTQMVGEKKAAVLRSVVYRDAAASRSISSVRKSVMVGFDDLQLELLDRLTRRESNRQIIPIVGMGGAGKTTLALNVFEHPLIKEHFDICGWGTISQNCDIQQTLSQVLSQVRGNPVDKSENELGEKLHKFLYGRKYLIVLDDMWSLEVWDTMKFFFPEYNNGSRVLVTTRLSNMASNLTDSNRLLNVKSLDEISSWSLLSKTVFGEDSFPRELEGIGKKIVDKCNGHPLAIVVIGGLMKKSQHGEEYWSAIEKNLFSLVNSENNEYCLRILRMSYNHLHVCLKPCFLYMGVFEEDGEIDVSRLIKLWVSEGFVKPSNNKSLETIAEEYLKELVDRNLVLASKLGSLGSIQCCKMHDLLRDLCLKEAKKQGLYYDLSDQGNPQCINGQRRIVIRRSSSSAELRDVVKSISHVRSILTHKQQYLEVLSKDFKLLRILSVLTHDQWGHSYHIEDVFQYLNLRYTDVLVKVSYNEILFSINLLWNLHTFEVPQYSIAPPEIWEMRQLRHVWCKHARWSLQGPPNDSTAIMENLQTLEDVRDFYLNEDVVKRIPYIKTLDVVYGEAPVETANCLSNLQYLSQLESFDCSIEGGCKAILQNICFPKSLKKLKLASLGLWHFKWEDKWEEIGSLPLLEKLAIMYGAFRTGTWETIEGQFPSLKVLELINCDLVSWIVSESSHLPRLQELRLSYLEDLEEIPLEIGEIPTLKSIELKKCSKSAVLSAKKIVEEQEELQGEQLDLHVRVQYLNYRPEQDLQYLESPNFHLLPEYFEIPW